MSSIAFGGDSQFADARLGSSRLSSPRLAGPRFEGTPRGLEPHALRLTRRGWTVLTIIALALCLGGAWATSTAMAGEPQQGIEVVRHPVEPGDTLWGLARSVATPDEDVRDVVVALQRLNRLSSADLRVGQIVLLPAHAGAMS